jgi:hypothetical protein
MPENLPQSQNSQNTAPDIQIIWHMRWFFIRLFALALLLSILASVIIVVLTRSPWPGLVPAPLLLCMRPIVRWLFPLGKHSNNQVA